MKIRLMIIMLMAVLGSSCSLFKRSRVSKMVSEETVHGSEQLQAKLNLETRLNTGSLKHYNDSLTAAYRIKFWPKGKITIAADRTIEGEFDSVEVQGHVLKGSKSDIRTDLQKVEKKQRQINYDKMIKTAAASERKEDSSSPDYIIIGICLIMIFGTIFWAKKQHYI